MTDTGATGSRRQREEWAALAARFREVAANVMAERERPTDPCTIWAERRQLRDEWEAPAASACGDAPSETRLRQLAAGNSVAVPEACKG